MTDEGIALPAACIDPIQLRENSTDTYTHTDTVTVAEIIQTQWPEHAEKEKKFQGA